MADFTGSEAEELRRALSFHRSEERMQKVADKLRDAMARKGVAPDVIEKILQSVKSFALYGFPESHAISFAILAYGSAYLKRHYAPEFYASLLNNQPMGFYSPATIVKDAKRHGLQMRPVCVRRSDWRCTIEPDDSVRLGLCIVQGLQADHGAEIVAQRQLRPFASIEDFKRRVPLNKDELRTLAEIGALNCFAEHRRDAMWRVEKEQYSDDLFEETETGRASVSNSTSDIFGTNPADSESAVSSVKSVVQFPSEPETRNPKPETPAFDSTSDIRHSTFGQAPLLPMNILERMAADYNGTSLTTGPHPMALARPGLPDIWRACDLHQAQHGSTIRIGGNVICRQRPGTAKGFVFISLEDETGVSNAIISPQMFDEQRLLVTQESFLMIEGRVQNVDNVVLIRAEHIEPLPTRRLVGTASHDFH
jgi:error-prone DNA polymerase